MGAIIRTFVVLAGWLTITGQPGITLFDMVVFLLAGILFQLSGDN